MHIPFSLAVQGDENLKISHDIMENYDFDQDDIEIPVFDESIIDFETSTLPSPSTSGFSSQLSDPSSGISSSAFRPVSEIASVLPPTSTPLPSSFLTPKTAPAQQFPISPAVTPWSLPYNTSYHMPYFQVFL